MTHQHDFRSLRSLQPCWSTHSLAKTASFPRCYGPELTSRHFLAWCTDRKIELVHIQPGRPMQNGRVESFNGRMREECLTVSWFGNLFEARESRSAGASNLEPIDKRPWNGADVEG
jgi:transposase InsO family protein